MSDVDPTPAATVTLCILLWARPGRARDLAAYEDDVLALLADHRGRVIHRARVRPGPDDDAPTEVQLLELADQDALDAFLTDERRLAMADRRDGAVARIEVLAVDLDPPS